jgi:ubiquinone/menaquinone biosynthesis C-methylase UbiE
MTSKTFKRAGFDSRIVKYEYIHEINPKDFKRLIEVIDPRNGETILDAMCGYGAVSKGVLDKCKKDKIKVNILLLDESLVQIERAKNNLKSLNNNKFIVESLPKNRFPDNHFDKIVIKMGLHENPKPEQIVILKELDRILKSSGKLIIWDIMLDKKNQKIFQDIIRKKDMLAGFVELVKRRYFFTENEFIDEMKKSGFNCIKEFHSIDYRFSSKKRLKEELHNDRKKLDELNRFIRKKIPPDMKKEMLYKESKDDIQFNITKKIYVASKL